MPQGSLRELDIFETEWEKCLSKESFAYWLIRGDLVFFLYNDKWQPANWAQLLMSYRGYVTMLPFAFILTRMVTTKFNRNFLIVVTAIIASFVAAYGGYYWIEGKVRDALAPKSNCLQAYVKTVLSTYSTDRIARQLEFKLTNELQRNLANPNLTLRLKGNDYVLSANLRRAANTPSEKQIADDLKRFHRGLYCSDTPYWVATRAIKYNLAVSVSLEGWPIFSQRLEPKDCATM